MAHVRAIWKHVESIGLHYGVNPIIFGCLYVAHHPLFWGTMAWLAHRVRRKQNIALQIILGVIFWTMPYAYVLLRGRGLPWWAYVAAVLFVVVGGRHAFFEVKRKLNSTTPRTLAK